MNLLTYTALFRDLAARHKQILATKENGRFLRILISTDFVQKQLDLGEFYNTLRSGLKARGEQPFLVLENYQTEYVDDKSDNPQRELSGAFQVLQFAKKEDYDARDRALASCEAVAQQLLAAVVYLLWSEHQVYASLGDAWSEHVGPLADGFVGVRVNLSWKEPAAQELTYDPTNFN